MRKILISTLLAASFFQQIALAEALPKEKKDSSIPLRFVGDEAQMWKIDLFGELEKSFPSIRGKEVFYMSVTPNPLNIPGPDQSQFDTSITVQRGNGRASFKPTGQRAQPGDVVDLFVYKQKLQVYIPSLKKMATIAPVRGVKMLTNPVDVVDDLVRTNYRVLIDQAASSPIEFKSPRPQKRKVEPQTDIQSKDLAPGGSPILNRHPVQ